MNHERDHILAQVRRLAELNGGEPVGERTFRADTRLSRRRLQSAGFPNYGAAVEAAGFARKTLQQAFPDDQLFQPLARLTREKGHFPTTNERQVERYRDSTFPGYDAYARRAKLEPLEQALLRWCRKRESFQDVVAILEATLKGGGRPRPSARRNRRVVNGYVYLMRYGNQGRDYKIGSTENVARRESQLDMMSPTDVRRVHVIETDDPRGIEKYWLERFADRRIKTKEVFRLTPEDVAAFKSRDYQ